VNLLLLLLLILIPVDHPDFVGKELCGEAVPENKGGGEILPMTSIVGRTPCTSSQTSQLYYGAMLLEVFLPALLALDPQAL